MRSDPVLLSAGDVLASRYEIVRLLGRGGMGAVYLARDLRLTRAQWAIKEMWADALAALDQDEARQAFEQEANLLASLSHPHLPRVTDFFTENHRQYLVMEYVSGRTLEDIVTHDGPLAPARAVNYGQQICDLLSYLHQRPQPIIFRDIKPSNIMIDDEDRVKLIDFGIARLYAPDKTDDTVALGTPGYASPEQYGKMGQSDVRSDVYGLGATLHFAVTGRDPQNSPFVFEPPSKFNPASTALLDNVILTAVQPNPTQRFQTARALATALTEALAAGSRPTALLDGSSPSPAAAASPTPGNSAPTVATTPTAGPAAPTANTAAANPAATGNTAAGATAAVGNTTAAASAKVPVFEPPRLRIDSLRRGEQSRMPIQVRGQIEPGALVSVGEPRWLRVEPRQPSGPDPMLTATIYTNALPLGAKHATYVELRTASGVARLPVEVELTAATSRGWVEVLAMVCAALTLVPLFGVLSALVVLVLYLAGRREEKHAMRITLLLAVVLGALNAFLCIEAYFFFSEGLRWVLHHLGI
jgi:hypothetical protein